jgi:sodium pump decarboxylase gamma subunit
MLEDLLVCIIGLAVVFVVLAILMFVIIGMGKLFGSGEEGVKDANAAVETKPEETKPEAAVSEDATELAVIALAMASYLRQRGRDLVPYITINNMKHQVNIGDLHSSPISVEVNGEKFWADFDGEDSPISIQPELKAGIWPRDTRRGSVWRAAWPPTQGGYWSRGGWTGRRAVEVDRE